MYPFQFDRRYTQLLTSDGVIDIFEESVCLCFFWKNWNRPHTWTPHADKATFRDEAVMNEWGEIWKHFSHSYEPALQIWREPFFYVVWLGDEHVLSNLMKRFVYEWMRHFFENPHKGLFNVCRTGGAWGRAYILRHEETYLDGWGPVFNRARTIALHASATPLWVEEHFYEHVYEYFPARSFPPVRVKENRERLQLFKFEWGLPGQYLIQPPPTD